MEDSSYRQGSFTFIPAFSLFRHFLYSGIFFIPAIFFNSVIPVSDIFRSLLSVRDGFPHGYLHRSAASVLFRYE